MARYDQKIQEEELKLRVAEDWFSAYDTRRIIGKVDFSVAIPATELGLYEPENALWAEAKAGVRKDIHESFVQLILTIGRARTFDHERPPIFLGAFDAEKIAFLPFAAVQDVSRIQIDKNNFTHIYRKWREHVLPHIDAPWDTLKKKYSLYDRDFYLAELNVDDNGTADISDDRVASDFYITFNAHGQNRISCEHGVNHWIPFAEEEVGAQDCFASHFMSDFLKGKARAGRGDLFSSGDRNVAAPADCGAVGTSRPTALDYYRSYELGKTWYDVTDPNDLLTLKPIVIDRLDEKTDRQTIKDLFRAMKPVRNILDGRVVRFPVKAAKKISYHHEINIFGLATKFQMLFAASQRLWSEKGADIPNHLEHRNINAYHQYGVLVNLQGEDYCIRFTVREDIGGVSRNELHGQAISRIRVYKAKDTGLSLLSHIQAEGPVPFVDNKIALFLSAVNGGAENDKNGQTGFVISAEARAVLDAGRELWRYYHAQPGANPNASYYDIRKFFQGVKVDAKGKEKMNATSGDEGYSERLAALKAAMKRLAAKIEPKVYEYGFLKK